MSVAWANWNTANTRTNHDELYHTLIGFRALNNCEKKRTNIAAFKMTEFHRKYTLNCFAERIEFTRWIHLVVLPMLISMICSRWLRDFKRIDYGPHSTRTCLNCFWRWTQKRRLNGRRTCVLAITKNASAETYSCLYRNCSPLQFHEFSCIL